MTIEEACERVAATLGDEAIVELRITRGVVTERILRHPFLLEEAKKLAVPGAIVWGATAIVPEGDHKLELTVAGRTKAEAEQRLADALEENVLTPGGLS